MINGRTRLHVVANGTMTGQRYIDEVLLPHVRLFRGAVGDKFVFMDDNATCHRTLAVQDIQDSEGIQRLVWPACSSDLNLIENMWDALGRQVAGRNYPPTNKNTLIRALTEEWDKLPQQLLDNVVQRFCERDTRKRWRDGQVYPDVDKELWRLGPDGSGVFWHWTSVSRCGQGTMAPWARRLGRPEEKRESRKERTRKSGERERTEGRGKTEKRERRRKETERGSGRERVKPALNGEKG
ncbi:DDE_3 domain-containing protein [Trichonephila clavipes]|nr:DDE_3 domain-containing protein [Trichonephila clavipes]